MALKRETGLKGKAAKHLSLQRREEITGFLFVIPFAIGFLVFQLAPFVSTFVISLTNMRFISNLSNVRFVGIENFVSLLSDSDFVNSLLRSLYYSALFIPAVMVGGIVMALLINSKIYFRNVIRTAVFLPYVSTMVAVAVVWALLLEVHQGPVNMLLKTMGVQKPPLWLLGLNTSLPTVVMIAAWQNLGLFMITFLAALQGVPGEMYESALIDGAGRWKRFRYITLPMISPTSFFLLITAVLVSMQNFGPIQFLTKGGPGDVSTTLPINIYKEFFELNRMGYGTAQALAMFLLILGVTVVQWNRQKKWVNYA